MKLVAATNNKNKFIEIKNKFKDIGELELVPLFDLDNIPEIVEDGNTFTDNAVKKAKTISEITGLPALSDDSGLEIDALNGRPGIFSARYAGDDATDHDRNIKILEEMDGISNRDAKFVCVIAIYFPGGEKHTTRGEFIGEIAHEIKGDSGFGYDPIFYLPQYGKTVGEIPLDEKNIISHRAKALEKAKNILIKIIN
ncbi:XTP/dITP diphosphatase [Spirochaetota bacterium]